MPAINMRGTAHPLIRVANTLNGLRTALILRNTNTTLSRWKDKAGVDPVLKFGPNDYRMWMEGLNSISPDYPAPITNFVLDGRSTDGVTWTLTDDANTLAPKGADWELGEICINCVIWNPYSNGGEWWAYYHGGNNNAGLRGIGLLTSPTALPGTWRRYWNDGKPILSGGATYDAGVISDSIVLQISRNNFKMLYWASTAGNVTTTALATSTDGKAWTKYAGNPVMGLGTGNDAKNVLGAWAFLDANQRVHVYYCGEDSGGVGRVLYAYSDDFITWTRDATDVKLQGLGAAAVASATVSVHVDIPRRKSKLLSLNYVAFAAAVGSAAITITAVKRTNTGTPGNVTQTSAQDITAGAITTLDKAYSVPITATDSNAIFQIGDTLRVDIICAGTVTTQPQGKVVAEWAVLA
jgi:hypothetical protein